MVPLLRFFEKRIGRQPDVEDLVQEVFLRLAAGGQVESADRPDAYLFKTATSVLLDRQRRSSARAWREHDSYEEESHGSAIETLSPERTTVGTQTIEQLVTALYELPERTRVIWTLYHLENLAHVEIGRRLGIAVSTIEKHMGRANAYLLKRVDRSI